MKGQSGGDTQTLNMRISAWYHLSMIAILIFMVFLFAGTAAEADIYQSVATDGSLHFTNTPVDRSGKMVLKEESPAKEQQNAVKEQQKGYRRAAAFYDTGDYQSIIEEKARQHNMDPQLIKAVIKTESNWNANAVSPKGACGLMQLMPTTASLLGVADIFDPEENIDGGTRYLKYLLGKFDGNVTLALAAYNAGPKRVERKGGIPSIPETVAYVKKVLGYYNGNTMININSQEIQREIKKEFNRIKKLIMEDGTVLFTNSYLANSYLKK